MVSWRQDASQQACQMERGNIQQCWKGNCFSRIKDLMLHVECSWNQSNLSKKINSTSEAELEFVWRTQDHPASLNCSSLRFAKCHRILTTGGANGRPQTSSSWRMNLSVVWTFWSVFRKNVKTQFFLTSYSSFSFQSSVIWVNLFENKARFRKYQSSEFSGKASLVNSSKR